MVASQPRDAMDIALAHLSSLGFAPKTIVDSGAAVGSWSIKASAYFPGAQFYLFEPLVENERYLKPLYQSDSRFHYFLTALGAQAGESSIYVHPDHDGSSVLIWDGQEIERRRAIPMTTLDQMIEAELVKAPDLMKLDVQGYELEVMKGARRALESAQIFIVEVNLYEFSHGCPRVHDVITFFAAHNFYLFDVAGMLRRPYDNSLAQMDLVFLSASSPLASNRWN
jgi:FkbM family methyltransferase